MPEPKERGLLAPSADAILDAIGSPIVILDEHTRIVQCNAAWSSAMNSAAGELYAPDDVELCEGVRAVCDGSATCCEHDAALDAFAGRAFKVRASLLSGSSPRLCLVIHQAQSPSSVQVAGLRQELAAAHQQLLQAQKLESVGRLTSGVAHDFNNMLTSIICFTRFVVDEMVAEDPRRADLIEVLKSADHAARLTNQLLAFSRRKPLTAVSININDAVTSVGRVLRRTLGDHIELVIEPSDQALWVSCDPGQFDQLLFNLAVQAKDSLPSGGTIRLRLGRTWIEDVDAVPTGDCVEIVFAHRAQHSSQAPENGAGVESERGSGLSLATCRVIAEQAKGALLAHSDGIDEGYRILLPAVAEGQGGARRASLTPVQLRGTVLVVEDQPAILQTMVRALTSSGMSVLEAGSAEDALAVLDARPELRLELIVTDVVLPRMSGPHLVEQLRERFTDLRALFVSGYIGEEIAASVHSGDKSAFVMKPFSGRQLAIRAAVLLGQRTAPRPRTGA